MRGSTWYQTFLSPKPATGGGAAPKTPTPDDSADSGSDSDDKLLAQLQRLTSQAGGEAQAMRVLFDNNLEIRRKYQRARDRVEELRGKVPADNDVVLSGDEATAWNAIKALNIPAKELADRITKAEAATTKLASYERNDVARQAAETLGYEAEVLIDRLERDGLHLEIATVTEKVDGQEQTTRVPRVRKASNATEALQDLDKYAEGNWKKYWNSLLKEDASKEGSQPLQTRQEPVKQPAPVTRSGEQRSQPGPSADQLAQAAAATGMYRGF